MSIRRAFAYLLLPALCLAAGVASAASSATRERARANALEAQKAFVAADRFIRGWWDMRDTDTALIPENLRNERVRRWTPENAAADNWPYMVLAARFVNRPFYDNECRRTLADEQRLTNRLRRLPDDFDLLTNAFVEPQINHARVLFGAAEYCKDGLIPLAEILGPETPYFARMRELIDDLLAESKVETKYGPITAADHEVNGDMLQTLTRLWWATRDARYLDMAGRIAQQYLLDAPPAQSDRLRLRDHGGEIVNGLCEFYVAAKTGNPDLAARLRAPLLANLDRVLEVGRNDDGLFYNEINPAAGEVRNKGVADTWGYVMDGYYALYLVEGVDRYREATRQALAGLAKYRDYKWEGNDSMDGMADVLESALTLLRWEPVDAGFEFCAHTYNKMLATQKASGIFEGWHGDGNAIRSALMYAFHLTQGAWIEPWREDVAVGAAPDGDALVVCITAQKDWSGRLFLDRPRHRDFLNMEQDYPRINGFAEWFTISMNGPVTIEILNSGQKEVLKDPPQGIPVQVKAGRPEYYRITTDAKK